MTVIEFWMTVIGQPNDHGLRDPRLNSRGDTISPLLQVSSFSSRIYTGYAWSAGLTNHRPGALFLYRKGPPVTHVDCLPPLLSPSDD